MQDRKLASFEDRMAGLGVGAQYGFAWCGAKVTETAASACAKSLRAIGENTCAAAAEAAAEDARSQAARIVTEGKGVGINAADAVPCD